jgi:hypothetical protein
MVSLEGTADFVGKHSLDEVLNTPAFVAAPLYYWSIKAKEIIRSSRPAKLYNLLDV